MQPPIAMHGIETPAVPKEKKEKWCRKQDSNL